MLSRTTRIQLLAFVVIAVLGVVYIAIRYVGIASWIGASGYTVKVDLADSGGIFTNAEVVYNGVPVGRVGALNLTSDGVQVDLRIDSDDNIPADAHAIVADRSVIGEQYVDLRPTSGDGRTGPYLHDGSVIARQNTALPPSIQQLLTSGDQFARSVPQGDLKIVVDELYDATQGLHDNLRQLLSTSQSFFAAADADLPNTIDLIDTGKTVLATQNQQSAAITSWAHDLSLVGAQLKASNGDISTVLKDATGAATEFGGFIGQIHGSLQALLTNLLPTAVVFDTGKNGLREVFVQLPKDVSIGNRVITSAGINVGLVPTFFDPLPCVAGYGGTTMRSGQNTAGNPALNLNAQCTEPASAGNVRGSQNAPKAGK